MSRLREFALRIAAASFFLFQKKDTAESLTTPFCVGTPKKIKLLYYDNKSSLLVLGFEVATGALSSSFPEGALASAL